MRSSSLITATLLSFQNETIDNTQGRIKAVFEVINCFWVHENWHPNFDR